MGTLQPLPDLSLLERRRWFTWPCLHKQVVLLSCLCLGLQKASACSMERQGDYFWSKKEEEVVVLSSSLTLLYNIPLLSLHILGMTLSD